ncbi:MAG: hypothetical protein ACWA5K_02945 [bacterium]
MTDIQPADPLARRLAIWVIIAALVFAVIIVLLIRGLEGALGVWIEANIEWLATNLWLVFVISLLFVSPLLIAGVYLYRLGGRIIVSRRIPPPGYAVARDTRIVVGRAAVIRGWIVKILSAFVVAATTLIPVFLTAIFLLLCEQL